MTDFDKLVEQVMRDVDVATSEEIADDRQVHVLDNGASLQVADEPPVYPDEMGDAVSAPSDARGYPGDDYVRGGMRDTTPFRDDFVEKIKQRAEAYVGPNGELLDELDALGQLQAEEREVERREAPFVTTAPRTALEAVMGGTVRVWTGTAVPTGGQQDELEVARWQGLEHEAQEVTVSVSPASRGIPTGTSPALFPFATICWSSRGAEHRVIVDVGRGVSLTINCSGVYVLAALTRVAGTATFMDIAASLAFGAGNRSNTPLQRTDFTNQLADAASFTSTVPPFAKRLTVWRGNTTVVAFTLLFLDSTGTERYRYVQAAATNMVDSVPLSDDIVQVQVTNNNGAGNAADFRFIYELGI